MYIAMDMGTTHTRLWLCDDAKICHYLKGCVGAGVTKTKGKDFLFLEIKNLISSLLQKADCQPEQVECIIVSGMAGSELGLTDIPHLPLPADLFTLASHLQTRVFPEIINIPFLFVPGLKKSSNGLLQDVMRGEETESIGMLPDCDAVLVLPGTHNKIISISNDGTITDFYTTMSGEVLHNMVTNSILSGTVQHDFVPSESFIREGAAYAKENGLNAALFHIRVMSLNGLPSDTLSSFLYGAVLSQDVEKILRFAGNKPIFVGGSHILKTVYAILIGSAAQPVDELSAANATQKGLSAILKLHRRLQEKNAVLSAIAQEKIIAILRAPDRETLLPAVKALYDGGIRLVEVTFDRSGNIPHEVTAAHIKALKDHTPMLVGAGTVTTLDELRLAETAGALYIISPNCDPDIIRATRKLGLVSIPAAYTPTEIAAAIHSGADYVKIFPADTLPKGYIKAVKAPLSDAKLLAVGGVTAENAQAYLHDGYCGVGVGSNLYNRELIARQDWQSLTDLASTYVEAVKKA